MKNIRKLKSTSDGWRGTVADTFTFREVELLVEAIAKYILDKADKKKILIAYDTRFLGKEFAQKAAQVTSTYGIKTLITKYPIPTPMLSFRVNQLGYFCGISITASHNPYTYNGIKLRMGYGGPPTSHVVNMIESYLQTSVSTPCHKAPIDFDNPVNDYIRHIRSLIDMKSLNSYKAKIVVDPMYGTTKGLLKRILANSDIIVDEIHSDSDPYFGGDSPEPLENTTSELQEIVSRGKYNLGIAFDGDGDRLTATLPDLGFISSHEISAILLWYLVKEKKLNGLVIGSVTLSRRISRLSKCFGLIYREIPVGFRNASSIMLNHKVLIAAEENGGVGFGFYLPERDATLAAAVLLEAEAKVKGGLSFIIQEIERLSGKSGFCRLNINLASNRLMLIQKLKVNLPDSLIGEKINKVRETDGLKIFTENGNWVCIRAAGTEDLVRIYAEADSTILAEELAKETEVLIRELDKTEAE